MKPTTFATKRLWLRRSHRVIAKVSTPYDWAITFFKKIELQDISLVGMIVCIIFAVGNMIYDFMDATPNHIVETRKISTCVNEVMIVRIKDKAEHFKPFTNRDVSKVVFDCKNKTVIEKQINALK